MTSNSCFLNIKSRTLILVWLKFISQNHSANFKLFQMRLKRWRMKIQNQLTSFLLQLKGKGIKRYNLVVLVLFIDTYVASCFLVDHKIGRFAQIVMPKNTTSHVDRKNTWKKLQAIKKMKLISKDKLRKNAKKAIPDVISLNFAIIINWKDTSHTITYIT